MDLQPELSISSGLIKKDSISAKLFTRLGNYIIRNSAIVISLDRFMTQYLYSRGAKRDSVKTIAVWPVMEERYKGSRMSNPFRIENDFGDRVVIMYSGNHAYVHQLDTLLEAVLFLKENSRFLFVFIGGGVRKKDVTEFKIKHNLENIVQLPFQPRENIHNSLGSSDIQVVILGNGQVGYTHPNKVYGAMYIGKPILYIGPKESHVADLLSDLKGNISVQHGESKILANKIELLFSKNWDEINSIGKNNLNYANNNFHPDVLKQKMIDAII
jgi:glycosyltransferase involved in cell wall biosynthesis